MAKLLGAAQQSIPAAVAGRNAAERFIVDPGPAACESLSRHLLGVLDRESDVARSTGAAIACAAGCTFCCHQRVGVLPHEAIAIVRYLRTNVAQEDAAAIERQVHRNASRIDAMTAEEHRRANIPCAFLRDGRCSVYAVRPLACASYHSMSRNRCEEAYNRPEDMGTPRNARPVLLDLKRYSEALLASVQAALEAAGIETATGELHQLLRALLEDPEAADRGCAGP